MGLAEDGHASIRLADGHGDGEGDPSTLDELLDDVVGFHAPTLPQSHPMSNFFLHYISLNTKDLRRGGGR